MASRSIRVAGDEMNENIIQFARDEFNLLLGERTAEEVKIKIGSATKLAREESMNVKGRDVITGLPRTVVFTSTDIYQALQKPLERLGLDVGAGGIVRVGDEDQPRSRRDRPAHGVQVVAQLQQRVV